MKLVDKEERAGVTLDELLMRFGIDPEDHLIGLSEFVAWVKKNPWVMEETDKNADLFAYKLIESLNLDREELEAASEYGKQWELRRLQ